MSMQAANDLDSKLILVCCGTGCLANGSREVYQSLKKQLTDSEVTVSTSPSPPVATVGEKGLAQICPMTSSSPVKPDVPAILKRPYKTANLTFAYRIPRLKAGKVTSQIDSIKSSTITWQYRGNDPPKMTILPGMDIKPWPRPCEK